MFIFQWHMAVPASKADTVIGINSLQHIWKYHENFPSITMIWSGNRYHENHVLFYIVNNSRCRTIRNLVKRKGKSGYQQKHAM